MLSCLNDVVQLRQHLIIPHRISSDIWMWGRPRISHLHDRVRLPRPLPSFSDWLRAFEEYHAVNLVPTQLYNSQTMPRPSWRKSKPSTIFQASIYIHEDPAPMLTLIKLHPTYLHVPVLNARHSRMLAPATRSAPSSPERCS